MTRIVIADDQEMIRLGLRGILSSHEHFTIIGEASDGLQAVSIAAETLPDIILMDIRMPGIDGVEAVRRIRSNRACDPVKILILTTFENDQNVINAIKAGAQGFLGKNVGPQELIKAVQDITSGGTTLSPEATRSLVTHVSSPTDHVADPQAKALVQELTDRERTVVKAAAQGLTNDQIAANMFISPYTVKTHLNRAMTKTGARDRSQLVVLAYRAGLAGSPQ
jgi:DNA-binding NarL/FixJ family response regulator